MSDKKASQDGSAKLEATAYHEAGHAVMTMILGGSVHKVSISAAQLHTGGMRLGVCELRKGGRASSDALEDTVLMLLSGMVAEAQFTGEYCQRGAQLDLLAVRRLLQSRASSEKQYERLYRRMLDKTEYLLGDAVHAKAVELVAKQLLLDTTISGRAVKHLFESALRMFS